MPIKEVQTEQELQEALQGATGPVALEFYADWCEHCQEEAPKLEQVAAQNSCATIVKVNVDKAEALADAWEVEGMPTLYYAKKPTDLQPGRAKELPNAAALEKKLGGKCPLPRK